MQSEVFRQAILGRLSSRRHDELKKNAAVIRAADRRMWIALKQEYTLAEQFCTFDFTATVIFEPFAGSFVTTRWAAQHHGWTNSQPMDLADGYDLLTSYGRKLVQNVLEEHRPFFVALGV